MKKLLLGIFIAFTCFFVSMLIFGRVKYSKKISYNVEHYLENANDDGYTLKDTDELKGKRNKPTEAAYKSYAGFTRGKDIEQKTIVDGKDNTIKLYYTRNTHTLSITNNSEYGTVSNVSGTYKYEANVTLTVSVNEGYIFDGWYLDNEKQSTDLTYTITMPDKDLTFEAKYINDKYNLTLTKNMNEAGTIKGDGTYSYKSNVKVEATVETGYVFNGWYYGETLLSSDLEYSFNMPNKNLALTAKYGFDQYEVKVEKNIYDGGVITGEGFYDYESMITLSVEVNPGYTFSGWYYDNELLTTDLSFSRVMPNNDISFEARFTINSYNLTLTRNISDACEVEGEGTYEYKENITLKAITYQGYEFSGWYLNGSKVSTDSEFTITMPYADITYEARWNTVSYYLELLQNIFDAGTLTGGGLFDYKSNVTITATVNSGYTFLGWYNGSEKISSDLEYSFAMANTDLVYEAKYSINSYTITLSKNISDAGTISGDGTYLYKENINLVATLNNGYSFLGWFDGDTKVSSDLEYSFTMPYNNLELEAKYSINSYTITLSKNINAAGTVSGEGTYEYKETVTLVATSNAGYTFSGWYKDNIKVSTDLTYSFNMTYNDEAYEARWNTNSYTLNLSSDMEEAATITGAGDYDYNTTATAKVVLNTGYVFNGWFDGETKVSDSLEYSFTMPHEDVNLVAKFGYDSFDITISMNLEDAGTPSGEATYKYKDSVTVTITVNTGYVFDGWYNGDAVLSRDLEYSFTMPNSNLELTAKYIYDTYNLTIEQNMDGGTASEGQSYQYKNSITVSTTLEDGYVFVGWFVNDELKSEELSYTFTMPNSDLTIEVRYAYYTVTVIKNIDEAGTIPEYNETKVRPGFTVSLLATEENGYSFMGWYIDDVLKTPNYTYNYIMDASNVTIEARYTSYTLTVTKNFDFGTVSDYTDVKVTANSSVTLTATTNDGYSFVGWYIGEQLIDSNKEYDFIMPRSSVTVEGRFTYYTLTVEIDDEEAGTVSEYANVKVENGSEISVTVTLNDVYYLVGWYINDELVGEELTYTFNMPKKSIVIIAKTISYELTVNQALINGLDSAYLVTFESNGGTTILPQYSNNLEYVYIYKEGYAFAGWYLEEDFSGAPFDFLNDTITEDITLYARWIETNYFLDPSRRSEEYVSGQGAWTKAYAYVSLKTQTMHLETYHSGNLNRYVVYIYDIDNNEVMHQTSDGEHSYMDIYFDATAGEVFYAKVYIEYEYGGYGRPGRFQVLFGDKTGLPKSNGYDYADTTSYINKKIKVDSNVTLKATPKNGTTFVGWFIEGKDAPLSTELTYTYKTEATNATIYAKYIYYTFTTENANPELGSITTNDNTKVKVGDNVTITATPNENCAFVGWFDESDNLVTDELSYTYKMTNSNVKFTSKFVSVTVTLNKTIDEAGSVSISDNLRFGHDATITATVDYGYIFMGWFNSSDELVSGVLTYTFTLEETNIYTAKYIVNTLTVIKNIDEAASFTDIEYGYLLNQEIEVNVTINKGYTWYGWYLNDEFVTKDLTLILTVTENTKAYELRFGKYVVTIETNYDEAYQDYATITFDSNGGSSVDPQKSYELKYVTPTKSGYVFVGWFKDAELEEEYVFDEVISNDITLYAKWVEKAEPSETRWPDEYSQTIHVININQTIWVGNLPLEYDSDLYEFIPLMDGTITFVVKNYQLHPWGESIFLVILDSNKNELVREEHINETRAELNYNVVKGETYFLVGRRSTINNYARNASIELIGDFPTILNTTSRNGDVCELGSTVHLVAMDREGYEFVGWYSDSTYDTLITTNRDNSFIMPENSVTYYAKYSPKEVNYTVYYHLENGTNDDYSDGGSDVFSGIASELTNAIAKEFTNYTPEEFEQVIIHGDGSSEVHICYKRNKFNLTVAINDELAGTNSGTIDGLYKFGSQLTIKGSANVGYTFTGVLVNEELHNGQYILEMPEADITVTLVFSPKTNTNYKLRYFRQRLNGEYNDYPYEEQTLQGTTYSIIEVTKEYEGFTVVPYGETRISGDGSTVLDVYFARNVYTVTVKIIDKEHSRLETEGFTYDEENDVYTMNVLFYTEVELKLDANKGYNYDCWFIGDSCYSPYWRCYYTVEEDVAFEARVSPKTGERYVVRIYTQENINEYIAGTDSERKYGWYTNAVRWEGITDHETEETVETLKDLIPEGYEIFEIQNIIFNYETDNYVYVYCIPIKYKLTVSRNNIYDNTILVNGEEVTGYIELYHGQDYTLKLDFDPEPYWGIMEFNGWYEIDNGERYSCISNSREVNNLWYNETCDSEIMAVFNISYTVTYQFRRDGSTTPITVYGPEERWGICGDSAEFGDIDLFDDYKDLEHYRYMTSIMYFENGVPCSRIGMKNPTVVYLVQEVPL